MMKIRKEAKEKNKYISQDMIISYVHLRRLIGFLGMFLTPICYLGGKFFAKTAFQDTLSAYYYTNARELFTGTLIVVASFLLTYKGYEDKDQHLTSFTGLFALGIAVFPCTDASAPENPVGIFQIPSCYSNYFHSLSALLFFAFLAYTSIALFTKTDAGVKTTLNKIKRNRIYRACGIIILIALVLFVFAALFVNTQVLVENHILIILETLMLEAFGISWLVKGEVLFKDAEDSFESSPQAY